MPDFVFTTPTVVAAATGAFIFLCGCAFGVLAPWAWREGGDG